MHDLRDPRHSLVHIVNGHVTGRQPGSPIRDLIHRVLQDMDVRENGLFNYLTVLDDGRRLKSSTSLLRNEKGEALIAFCVNLDVTALEGAVHALSDLVRIDDRQQPPKTVDEAGRLRRDEDEVANILRQLVVNVVRPGGRSVRSLRKWERLAAVEFLEKKGAFRVKGAIRLVARELGVSEPTIYRDIDEVRHRAEEPSGGSAAKQPRQPAQAGGAHDAGQPRRRRSARGAWARGAEAPSGHVSVAHRGR